MTSRERRRPQSGGVFERRGNELQLKPKYESFKRSNKEYFAFQYVDC